MPIYCSALTPSPQTPKASWSLDQLAGYAEENGVTITSLVELNSSLEACFEEAVNDELNRHFVNASSCSELDPRYLSLVREAMFNNGLVIPDTAVAVTRLGNE